MNDEQIKAQWFEWFQSDKKFTAKDVETLVEKIKEFNAGAIDQYLTNHVDKTLVEWMQERN